jgi:trimethylamine--corrinoid protein Co-methyltransferase
MSLCGAILGHGNLVYHGAGWQEGGLTVSYEKLILDVEMLQMMIEFLKPIVVRLAPFPTPPSSKLGGRRII